MSDSERWRFGVTWFDRAGRAWRAEAVATQLSFGRTADNAFTLQRGNLSKRHQRVLVRDGEAFVVDMKSTGGTYVNGRLIGGPHRLQPTDRVYLSDYSWSLTQGPVAASVDDPDGVRWVDGAPPDFRVPE